jgi:hypothetical protein
MIERLDHHNLLTQNTKELVKKAGELTTNKEVSIILKQTLLILEKDEKVHTYLTYISIPNACC